MDSSYRRECVTQLRVAAARSSTPSFRCLYQHLAETVEKYPDPVSQIKNVMGKPKRDEPVINGFARGVARQMQEGGKLVLI